MASEATNRLFEVTEVLASTARRQEVKADTPLGAISALGFGLTRVIDETPGGTTMSFAVFRYVASEKRQDRLYYVRTARKTL